MAMTNPKTRCKERMGILMHRKGRRSLSIYLYIYICICVVCMRMCVCVCACVRVVALVVAFEWSESSFEEEDGT